MRVTTGRIRALDETPTRLIHLMGFDLTKIIRGTGRVKIGSSTYIFPRGAMELEYIPDVSENVVEHIGRIDSSIRGKQYVLRVPHSGEFEFTSVLFAMMAMKPGASVFGSTNTAVVVDFEDGRRLTLHRAAITKMPDLDLSTGSPMLSAFEITALLDVVTPRANTHAAAFYTLATGQTYPGNAEFDASKIYRGPWAAVWGSSPFDSFYSEDGFKIKPKAMIKPVFVDGRGIVDYTMMSNEVDVEFSPIGVATMAELLTLGGAETELGASSGARKADLNLSVTGAYVRVRNAVLQTVKSKFSADPTKAYTVTLKADRSFTTGVADDLLYLGTEAPV